MRIMVISFLKRQIPAIILGLILGALGIQTMQAQGNTTTSVLAFNSIINNKQFAYNCIFPGKNAVTIMVDSAVSIFLNDTVYTPVPLNQSIWKPFILVISASTQIQGSADYYAIQYAAGWLAPNTFRSFQYYIQGNGFIMLRKPSDLYGAIYVYVSRESF